MIKPIVEYLQEHAGEIYPSNYPSVAKVLHHSLTNKDGLNFFKKYKLDTKKYNQELFDWIRTHESEVVKSQSNPYEDRQRGYPGMAQNDSGIDIMRNIFSQFNVDIEPYLPPQRPAPRNKETNHFIYELNQVLSLAYSIEMQDKLDNLRKNPMAAMGQESLEIDSPTLASFLLAMHRLISHFPRLKEMVVMLESSGFNWQKLIDDAKKKKLNKQSVIDELCENLNEKALAGKIRPVIGRDEEIMQSLKILKKAVKNNPILIGKPGVGKTAIVEGLAKKIVDREVPESLSNAVVYKLQVMDMVKGTEFRGAFEKKIASLIEEFKEMEEAGEVTPILFIDEFHSVVGAGGNNANDLANFLKPSWSRGQLRTIGATTTDEWHKYIKKDGALDRRFYPVTVKEPSAKETVEILEKSVGFYENSHDVKYDTGVILRAVELTGEFIVDNAYPDKAFDLIDFAGSDAHIRGVKRVLVEDVERALAEHKKIPLEAIMESKRLEMTDVRKALSEKIFGQEAAIETISHIIDVNRYGLGAEDKPLGAVLMAGPTGVGKTEMAKQVAKIMKAHLHVVDMSEYMEKHSISKLIGAPAGYVGYDDGSALTKVILENPRTVLLLDEVEKAHPDVLNILLQAMDRGQISDAHGKVISFRNVFLMMTTNAGAESSTKGALGLGATNEIAVKNKMSAVNAFFRPEFIARLDTQSPILFNPLPKTVIHKVALKEIKEYEMNVLAKKNIKLDVSKEVLDFILKDLNAKLGARPIKGAINNLLVSKLVALFKVNPALRDTVVKFSLNKDEIVVKT